MKKTNIHCKITVAFALIIAICFCPALVKADDDQIIGAWQLITPTPSMGRDSRLIFEPDGNVTIIWWSIFSGAQTSNPPRYSQVLRGAWKKKEEIYKIQILDVKPSQETHYYKLISEELMECDKEGYFLSKGLRWSRKIS